MTLEEAKRISDLLKLRGTIVHDLERVEQCRSITGTINDGANGLGFTRWGSGDGVKGEPCRETKYLIAGYKADIAVIDAMLESLSSPNFPET